MSHLINTGHEDSIDAVDDLRLADRHVEHVHVRKSCPVSVKFKINKFVINYFWGSARTSNLFSLLKSYFIVLII